MPLTGTDPALMEARSGIARAGATRSGYYTPNVVATIAGVDRSVYIRAGSLAIGLRLNDRPDTASFTLEPEVPAIPVVNQPAVLGLGTAVNRVFAGQISRVKHRRRFGNQTPWVDVDCIDWTRLFDRRRITTEYGSQSATTTAVRIVQDWTSGFTTTNIQAGLPTVSFFPLTNEKPSSALRRLVALMGGGGFYLGADRDVHLFGIAGETGARAPTAPLPLTNSLESLQVFTHEYDNTQQRTRVIVEGQRTTCPVSISLGTWPSLVYGAYELPVESSDPFEGFDLAGQARVGTQVITYEGVSFKTLQGEPNPSTSTFAVATIGATSIQVSSVTSGLTTWCRIGGQLIYFGDIETDPTRLALIPASGPGAVTADIAIGTQVEFLPVLYGIPASGSGSILRAQPKDVEVVYRLAVNDTAAQTALAAIEGGDGIHEHPVSDGRLNVTGATARAQAELAFSAALLKVKWETEDLNARPGAQQVINLTTNDPLSVTLTITDVDLRFPIPNYRPQRSCQASLVRLAGLLDVAMGEDH